MLTIIIVITRKRLINGLLVTVFVIRYIVDAELLAADIIVVLRILAIILVVVISALRRRPIFVVGVLTVASKLYGAVS